MGYSSNTCSKQIRTNHHPLNMAKNLFPLDCLCSIYFSHIFTHLQYNLVVWGSMLTKSQLSQIYQQQKLCLCLLGKGINKSTEELFTSLRVMKFPDMIRMELCKFGTRVMWKLIPKPLKLIMVERGGVKKHRYNTRKKKVPNIQKHTSVQFNTSFICHSITEYSSLSNELSSITKMPSFVKKLKKEIMNTYQIQT